MITLKILVEQAQNFGVERYDAEVLLAHTLKKNRAYLHTWPDKILSDDEQKQYQFYLERRLKGEPIAYIIGHKEFWSLPFIVTPNTLIPREDTESWIQWLLDRYSNESAQRVLDLGTGSGAIALALAHERPNWQICAVDFSVEALKIAMQNAINLKLTIECLQSDWFSALSSRVFDIIVANPPYIAEEEPHWQIGDLRFEPKTALVSADQGLSDLKHILQQAPLYLSANGLLLVEHGYQQGSAVYALFVAAGFHNVQTYSDYGNNPRWTVGYRP